MKAKVNSWRELTLREKIGQTVICQYRPKEFAQRCGSVEAFLERYPVGGVFNNGEELVKGWITGSTANFADVLDKLNESLRVPLFGAADNGSYAKMQGVEMPMQMAIGAANDEEVSYKSGEFRAHDFIKTGINWGFWPNCDLNMSKYDPVTNARATGDDPDLAYKIVKQQFDAMKANGVISCMKHFPGTPHDCYIDAHLSPVNNNTPMDLWWDTYGKLYKKLFADGIPAIMVSHCNLVNYQTEKIDGEYPPATMSYELMTKLLREELGFRGVAVTDALIMGGFGGIHAVDNTIKSLLAGNDIMLWPQIEYIDEMEKRILSGEVDERILDAAVERIWNLKKEYGILDGKKLTSDKDDAYFSDVIAEICKKCPTLLNNYEGMLPLDKNKIKRIFVVGVTPDDAQYEDICYFKEAFAKYGIEVKIQRNIWIDQAEKELEESDMILFALCRTIHRPIGPLDFFGDDAASIWASNALDKSRTMIVNLGNPYLYKYYNISGLTYINAYNHDKRMIDAVVEAMLGEIEFHGKPSVKDLA